LIVSPEEFLYNKDGKFIFSADNAEYAFNKALNILRKELDKATIRRFVVLCGPPGCGKSTFALAWRDSKDQVVYDATNYIPRRRSQIAQLGTEYAVTTEAIAIHTPLEICLKRNAARSYDRRVPVDVIRRIHRTIYSNPPSEDEGFDFVKTVFGYNTREPLK